MLGRVHARMELLIDKKPIQSELVAQDNIVTVDQKILPSRRSKKYSKIHESIIKNVTNIRPVIQFNKDVYHTGDKLYKSNKILKNSMSRLVFINAENNTLSPIMQSLNCSSKLVLPDQNTIMLWERSTPTSAVFSHSFSDTSRYSEGLYTQTVECGIHHLSFNKTFLFSNVKENRVQITVYISLSHEN